MITIKVNDFDLTSTLESGQTFRWEKNLDGSFTGFINNNLYNLKQHANNLIINGIKINKSEVIEYLQVDFQISKVKRSIKKDKHIGAAITYAPGLRILKQPHWETTASFILSSNNSVKRISTLCDSLAKHYGVKCLWNGKVYYKFPSPNKLSRLPISNLQALGLGFRAIYLLDLAKAVSTNQLDLSSLNKLSTAKAKERLMKIKGIGDKISDCILLFAFQRYDVCPKDVWIYKIFNLLYNIDRVNIDRFVSKKFGEYAGYAQQYLYHFARNKLKV